MPRFHNSIRIWGLSNNEANGLVMAVSRGRTQRWPNLSDEERTLYDTRKAAFMAWYNNLPNEQTLEAFPTPPRDEGRWIEQNIFVGPIALDLSFPVADELVPVARTQQPPQWDVGLDVQPPQPPTVGPQPRNLGELRNNAWIDAERGGPPLPTAWRNLQAFQEQAMVVGRAIDINEAAGMATRKPAPRKEVKSDQTVNKHFGIFESNRLPRHRRGDLHLSLPTEKFPYDHCVGLEIEVEQVRGDESKKELQMLVNEGFAVKPDGSLRNGHEYVTRLGLTAADACGYIKALDKYFSAGRNGRVDRNNFSFRCGLHVHVDVSEHTMEDIYRTCLLYTVVEPLLFEISGKRNSNKFCVGVHDCVSAVEGLLHHGHARDWNKFATSLARGSKYMAMNVRTVSRFGTIEFRHHEGTCDPDRVRNWLLVLCDIVVGAKKQSTAELEKQIEQLNTVSSYSKFLATYYPNSSDLLRSVKGFERVMYPGSTFIKQTFITDVQGNPDELLERD